MDLPDIFHTLSFAIENLRGAKLNRGLLTREKRVSLAVRPRSGGTRRPCRAQPLSYRMGGRSSGQSWLSCVPTMQASVESYVSKGAWGNRPQGGPIWLATKSPGTQLQIAGGKCGDRPDCPNSGLGGEGWNDRRSSTQSWPRIVRGCARIVPGPGQGGGFAARLKPCPSTVPLGVRFLVRVSSKAFGAGFVISHPFAKCAKGWGTRRLGGAGMSKASPRSSRIRADWTKPYSSPRRGVTEKINGKCGDRLP